MKHIKRIIVIGGGAAGFFGAIQAATTNPTAQVTILEKTSKVLSKVRVSGGGRCNVTHHCFQAGRFAANYPRGEKWMKRLLHTFGATETVQWFTLRGLPLVAEADGRMFPLTNSSQSVIDLFLAEAARLQVQVQANAGVQAILPQPDGSFILQAAEKSYAADKVLVTTGGGNKPEVYQWLSELGHEVEPPVPSLFTFNIADKKLHQLAGISMPAANVRIETTKWNYEGPLLITHWGLSGPAVLKLSAFAARWIAQQHYRFAVQLRWVAQEKEEVLRQNLQHYAAANGKQKVLKYPLFELPQRLWWYLCEKAGVEAEQRWLDLSKKTINRLVEVLYRDRYEVSGKTTFKEEFVTCGGVSLSEVDPLTLESKKVPGLYFAGEVLDVDGITGGFNFQSAWTTSWIAGSNM